MLRMWAKSSILLIASFALATCLDPYTPDLEEYKALLVVDGMITDDNASYTVRLSRTFNEYNSDPVTISDAIVHIADNEGNDYYLDNRGKGAYKTDSTEFRGVPGRTYILHIQTKAGEVYESSPCLMQSVPDIDSIYYKKDQGYFSVGTEISDGITILLDTEGSEDNKYYRWDFEETWEYKVSNPQSFEYIDEYTINQISDIKEYCWKSSKSEDVLIHKIYPGDPDHIEMEPVIFISSERTDRLMVKYSILIRQYSISKDDYDFWDNLKRINETVEDVFASQPFPVISNIHNVNNPEEQILGYFQVSAVKLKRKDILFNDIIPLNLPFYHYPCLRKEDSPNILPWVAFNPPMTWDDLYYMYTTSGYAFVEPKYAGQTKELDRLVFTSPECADCELTGTRKKPVFWIDRE